MIKYEVTDYKNYGKCLEMSNGSIKLIVTTDVGARIIYAGVVGGNNIMFEDLNREITKGGEYFDKNFGDGVVWNIFGGHRLWKSPEDLASYYPDNTKVTVKKIDNGCIFLSDAEKTTGLQKAITITFLSDDKLSVKHSFTNVSDKTVVAGLWTLSVMKEGGYCTIGLSTEDLGLLPNRNIVLWSYTDIKDKRIDFQQDKVIVKQDITAKTPLKLGFKTDKKITYIVDGVEFTKEVNEQIDAHYPDFECNVEVYTSNLMLEVETLSPIYDIAPKDTKNHTEIWTLKKV